MARKLWRPKDPRAITIIKLTLWSGLVTWMLFTLVLGIVMARVAAGVLPTYVGVGIWGQVWTWVVPVWIIFTTLMLIWAVARFANKRLRPERKKDEGI